MKTIQTIGAVAVAALSVAAGVAAGQTNGTPSGSGVRGAGPATTQAAVAAPDARVRQLLLDQLMDYRRYAETQWRSAAGKPGMGYWGTGRADGGNEGARSQSINAFVYAMLIRRGDKQFAVADRVDPALRYTAATHVTGDVMGTKDDKWGNSWQSAMYAGNMGVAAMLVQKQLSPETLEAVRRVVAYEADRFIDTPPGDMLPGDTKSEEIAWNLTAPAAAEMLMPDHPNAAKWREAVVRYGFNTIPVAADRKNADVVDGRPIREWVTTTQLYPDYTIENHHIFHPVYAMVGPATNGQVAAAYRVAGKRVPYALRFNVMREWEMLRYIALPDGEWIYPQGLDWDLHDYEHLHYWTMLATVFQHPAASVLEERTADHARRRQVINGDGRFVGASSNLGFAREAVQAERVAYALMMHEVFPTTPPSDGEQFDRMIELLPPAKSFPYVGFAVHRTARGIASFSWRNRLCAQFAPDSREFPDRPYVTTPNTENLVGRFAVAGQSGKDARKFQTLRQAVTEGRELTVVTESLVNDGKLRQQTAFVSLWPGVVLYMDWVWANDPEGVTVTGERGLPLSIENDDVSGNRRVLYTAEGETTVEGGSGETVPLTGNWVNVDGRIAMILPEGAEGAHYQVATEYNRPGAREDYLVGVSKEGTRTYKPWQVVARRSAVIMMNATPGETAAVAGRTRFVTGEGTSTIRTEVDGRKVEAVLAGDGSLRVNGQLVVPMPKLPRPR